MMTHKTKLLILTDAARSQRLPEQQRVQLKVEEKSPRTKRSRAPSPDKGRSGEGFAAAEQEPGFDAS
jgi:hypothetical protein